MKPGLLTGGRGVWLVALMFSAISQAAAAAAFAEVLSTALVDPGNMRILALLGLIAALLAGASYAERLVGEIVAQSYIHSVRLELFEALIAHRGTSSEAQWLNPLVNDLGALRNWAARGPVRLLTSSVALLLAMIIFVVRYPQLATAALPFPVCIALIWILAPSLRETIRRQRGARGGLTRFIVRRARIESAGQVKKNRHGRTSMTDRSRELGQLSVKRARSFALLEAIATAAPGIALLAVVLATAGSSPDHSLTIAAITLIGFAGARQLELVRAVHASIGGNVAHERIERVLTNAQHAKETTHAS